MNEQNPPCPQCKAPLNKVELAPDANPTESQLKGDWFCTTCVSPHTGWKYFWSRDLVNLAEQQEEVSQMRVRDMWRVCQMAVVPIPCLPEVEDRIKKAFYCGIHSIACAAQLMIQNEGGLDALDRLKKIRAEVESELKDLQKGN